MALGESAYNQEYLNSLPEYVPSNDSGAVPANSSGGSIQEQLALAPEYVPSTLSEDEQEEFVPSPEGPFPSLQGSGAYDAVNYLLNNNYGPIAGSVAAQLAARSPRKSVSAAGAGMGSLAQDAWQGKDVDFIDAAGEMMLDVAGNLIPKPLAAAGRYIGDIPVVKAAGSAIANSSVGRAVNEGVIQPVKTGATSVYNSVLKPDRPPTGPAPPNSGPPRQPVTLPGSPQSIQESQEFLLERGGGLTARQAGATGPLATAESIGEQGYFSKAGYEKQKIANQRAVNKEIEDIRGGPTLIDEGEDVGTNIYRGIEEAKIANSAEYQAGIDQIEALLGPSASVNLKKLSVVLRGFKNKMKDGGSNTGALDSKVSATISRFQRDLGRKQKQIQRTLDWNKANPTKPPRDLPTYSISDLTKRMQMLNAQAKAATIPGATQTRATVQLYKLREEVANFTEAQIRLLDPKAADKYLAINKEYGVTKNTLFDPINATSTGTAIDKGSAEAITKVFTPGGSPDRVKAYYRTIDKSYSKVKPNKDGVRLIGGKTKEETIALAQRTYTTKLFGGGGNSDVRSLAGIAESFADESNKKMAQEVLGEAGFRRVNRLMNAIIDSSKTSKDEIGSLIVNNAQMSAARGVVRDAATATLNLGGSMLFIPNFASWAASRPATVNKLIAALNADKTAKTGVVGRRVATKLMQTLIKEFNEEQAETQEQ
tara:strand:- start:2242 stop:4368 length:2127 start_codon:yes stop_codon:yes gene_type:complete